MHWMSFLSNYFGRITLEYSDLTEIICVKSEIPSLYSLQCLDSWEIKKQK